MDHSGSYLHTHALICYALNVCAMLAHLKSCLLVFSFPRKKKSTDFTRKIIRALS